MGSRVAMRCLVHCGRRRAEAGGHDNGGEGTTEWSEAIAIARREVCTKEYQCASP